MKRLRAIEGVVMDVPNGDRPDFSVVITTGTIVTVSDSGVEQLLLSSKSFVDADAPVSE